MLIFSGKLSRQSGAVLIISLIMLLLLTIIASVGLQNSGLEEKMAGNLRDRNLAFQAAEAGLRDAEFDISNLNFNNTKHSNTPRINGLSSFVADCGASTSSNANDDGLCYNGAAGYTTAPIESTVNMYPSVNTGKPSVGYGSFTNAPALPNLSAQPRYIIEGFRFRTPGKGVEFFYRITVRAQGVNENTVVWLQEFFKP
jgi:type IV pilus assembly protein PilX